MKRGDRSGSALVITMLILVILTAAGLYAVGVSTSGIESVSTAVEEQAAVDAAEAGLFYGIDRFPVWILDRDVRLPNRSRFDVTVSHTGTVPLPGYDMGWAQARFLVRAVGKSPRRGRRRSAEAEVAFGPVESGTEPVGREPVADGGSLVSLGPPSPYYHDARDPSAREVFVNRHAGRNRILLPGWADGILRIVGGGSGAPEISASGQGAPSRTRTGILSVFDIRVGGSPRVKKELRDTGWRTIALAAVSGKEGGLFAFDVTEPDVGRSPGMLWQIPHATLPMLGSAGSSPAVGRIRVFAGRPGADGSAVDRWVLLLGAENGVLVLEAETGRILQLLSHPDMGEVTAAPSIAFDRQGYIDRAYVGDLSGNLWRIVVNDSGRFDLGKGPFFTITGGKIARQIRARCAVVPVEGDVDGLWIFFGTRAPVGISEVRPGGVFGVVDAPAPARNRNGKADRITETDLVDASRFFETSDDPAGRFPTIEGNHPLGWHAILPAAGEQIRFAPRVFFSNLFLVTSVPVPKHSGEPGPDRIYGFGISPGKNLGSPALYDRIPPDADSAGGPNDTHRTRRIETDGISSPPVLSTEGGGIAHLTVRSTNGRVTDYRIVSPGRRKSILSWRNFREDIRTRD